MTIERADREAAHDLIVRSATELASGNLEGAERDARSAVERDASSAEAHNALGNILIRRGESNEAERAYRAAIALDSELHKPHHNLGNILRARGDLAGAASEYGRAIEIHPSAYRSFAALADVLIRSGKTGEAETAYRAALAFGETKEICLGLAVVLGDAKRFQEVAGLLERARALGASGFALEIRLTEAATSTGDSVAAEKAFVAARDASALEGNAFPRSSSLRLAKAALALNRASEAVDIAAAWIDSREPLAKDLNNEALDLIWRAKLAAGDTEGAWTAFERALGEGDSEQAFASARLFATKDGPDVSLRTSETLRRAASDHPDRAKLRLLLARSLFALGRPSEANDLLIRLRESRPKSQIVASVLGEVKLQLGEHDEALKLQRAAVALAPNDSLINARLLMIMHYTDETSREEIFSEHVRWGRRFGTAREELPPRAPHSKLRVGFLSGDFARHSVCRLLLGWLTRHDRSRFEVHAYMTMDQHDYYTDQVIASVHKFHAVHGDDAPTLLERLRKDELDVLVDLSGHSKGGRLDVLAHGAAPVQATYLGYPDTTGLTSIDYRITDANADPEDADAFAIEELIRLPRTAWCFAPDGVPRTPQRSLEDPIVFGSFNNLAKITPRVVTTWARILGRVENSQLLLKWATFGEKETRSVWEAIFARAGVDPKRLILAPFIPADGEHISLYGKVDIALDPFPYNGTMTTCEALAMGVPVISLVGERHASRVGLSLLSSVGLRELAAPTVEAYEDNAVDLALDSKRRARLREALDVRFAESELTDEAGFTRAFGAALEQMHERGPRRRH